MTPPDRMDFFTALAWCEAGWSIRPEICKLSDAITGQVPVTGDLDLFWLSGEPSGNPGVFFYTMDSAGGVNTANILTAELMKRTDWTCLPPSGTSTNPGHTDPNAGKTAAPAGAGGGSSGGGGGGGGGGGSGGGGMFGGSGGGGGGGSSPPGAPGKPSRSKPTLTVAMNNVTDPTCVMRDGSGEITHGPVTDDFTANIALSDTGNPGEIWFYSARWGCAIAGAGAVFMHGTISPGGNADGAFSVTVPEAGKGAEVVVTATAYLPLFPLSCQGSASDNIRNDCAPCPVITDITTPDDQTLTAGDSLAVGASAATTGGHALTYEWFNGAGASIGTGDTLSYGPLWEPGSYMFSVTITSDCGRVESRSFNVTVDAPTCGEHQHYDAEAHGCVYDDGYCAPGYHWGGTACISDSAPTDCSPGWHWDVTANGGAGGCVID